MTRIINTHNEILFHVETGYRIRIEYSDGETYEAAVETIDSTHFKFGACIYHIAQFADAFSDCNIIKL